jgi:hypothetical protein
MTKAYNQLVERAKKEGFSIYLTVVPGRNPDPDIPRTLRELSFTDETLDDSIKSIHAYMSTEKAKDSAKEAEINEAWASASIELKAKHSAEILALSMTKMIQQHYPEYNEDPNYAQTFIDNLRNAADIASKRREQAKKALEERESK